MANDHSDKFKIIKVNETFLDYWILNHNKKIIDIC